MINPGTKSLSIDVIQVANVSSDLRNVTTIFPMGTVLERVELRKPGKPDCSPNDFKNPSPIRSGIFSCVNSDPLLFHRNTSRRAFFMNFWIKNC